MSALKTLIKQRDQIWAEYYTLAIKPLTSPNKKDAAILKKLDRLSEKLDNINSAILKAIEQEA